MSHVIKQNNDEQCEQDNSPVCVVLRRYFESLKEQGRVIAEQRSMAMIGENDIVQEG